MSQNNCFIVFCVTFSFAGFVATQSTTPKARCFHFTWLGPEWNKDSIYLNATCQTATKRDKAVPCSEPLVVSLDGTWPDVEYIWRNHAGNASCVLAPNSVCAQHTYYFNGRVENSTYLCTRAVNEFGEAITRGCFEQRFGSFVKRTCFCQSRPGGVPCNNAALTNLDVFLIIVPALVLSIKSDLF